MKDTWILDEEGYVCSACGKDIFNCSCNICNNYFITSATKKSVTFLPYPYPYIFLFYFLFLKGRGLLRGRG